MRKRERGMTMIEVMMASTISTIVILALATFYIEVTKRSKEAAISAESSEDIALFNFMLHQYVSNSVQFTCNCNSNALCGFDPAVTDETVDTCDEGNQTGTTAASACSAVSATPELPKAVATFVTETAVPGAATPQNNMLQNSTTIDPVGDTCYVPTGGTWAAATMTAPRGCKKVFQLVYTRPTKMTGGLASQPGTLEIVDVTARIVANGYDPILVHPAIAARNVNNVVAGGRVIATLSNIAALRCGLTMALKDDGTPADRTLMNGFEMFVLMKVLPIKLPQNAPDTYPGATTYLAAQAPQFDSGQALKRRLSWQFPFRNITHRGRMFTTATTRPCVADGGTVTDWRDCCSQHVDAVVTTTCSANCYEANQAAVASDGVCCSHTRNVGGVCL